MKNGLWLVLSILLMTGRAGGQPAPAVSAKSGWVAVKKPVDTLPVIAWRNPLADRQSAPVGLYRLTVCIQSASPVTQVVIVQNGTGIQVSQRGLKRVPCGQEVSEDIRLVSGPNRLLVEAASAVGTARSEVRIVTGLSEKTIADAHPAGQKRRALILANAAYARQPLKNPLNDGRAMKVHLENLGFVVTYRENLPLRGLRTTIDTFLTNLGNNNVGLVYYAGHGLMVNGENYLQPVDANPSTEPDVDYECYPLSRLLARMGQTNGNGINLIFWDACRSNPYRSWSRGAGYQVFAPLHPASGTLIVYATEPNKPADDGGDEVNSHFTGELIRHIDEPNIDIFDLVDQIDRGLEARGINQPPYMEGRIRGKFFFKPVF